MAKEVCYAISMKVKNFLQDKDEVTAVEEAVLALQRARMGLCHQWILVIYLHTVGLQSGGTKPSIAGIEFSSQSNCETAFALIKSEFEAKHSVELDHICVPK